MSKDSTEDMKKQMEALQQEVMKMGEAMYKQAGAAGAPGADAGAAGGAGAGPAGDAKAGGDDVIDAEFTDK